MKYGIREICDVVLKAKSNQKVGNKIFYKNEPVIYFDTLKTSSLEGAATTVYAQGGRGNARLIAWEGERTVTFTMEDALISAAGFMILTGAGLIEASDKTTIKVHTTEQTADFDTEAHIVYVEQKPYTESKQDWIYVMPLKNGEVYTEPFIGLCAVDAQYDEDKGGYPITLQERDAKQDGNEYGWEAFEEADAVLVDYYVEHKSDAQQINITPDKFGGNYYLEASTLFRDTNGVDHAAEFVIPNCKIQSNFTFTMASSGDPSTFTFTMDAFPDYTRFDKTKKVLAAIQILGTGAVQDLTRPGTQTMDVEDANGIIIDKDSRRGN